MISRLPFLLLLFLFAAGSHLLAEEGAPVSSIVSGALPPSPAGFSDEALEAQAASEPTPAVAIDPAGSPAGVPDAPLPPGPRANQGEGASAAPDAEEGLAFLQRSHLIHAKILENERAVDPFGMVMDPANAKETPVLADQYAETEASPAVSNTALKTALLSLPITGIYPQRGMIVIGARSFPVGGQFGMKVQDLTIRLRFEGVRGEEVFFKDMETKEVTSIPFNTRPTEFEPLKKGDKQAPGSGIVSMGDLYIAN